MENLTLSDLKSLAVSLGIEPLSIRRKRLAELVTTAREEQAALPSRRELKKYCREHSRALGFSTTGKGKNKKYMLEQLARSRENAVSAPQKQTHSPLLRVIMHWSWEMIIETLALLGYVLDGEVEGEDAPGEAVCVMVRDVFLKPTQQSFSALFGKGKSFSQGFWRAYTEEIFPRYYEVFKGLKMSVTLNTYFRELVPRFDNAKWKVSGIWDFLFMECLSIESEESSKASRTFFSLHAGNAVSAADLASLVEVGALAVFALAERHPSVRTALIRADYSQYTSLSYNLSERQNAWLELVRAMISKKHSIPLDELLPRIVKDGQMWFIFSWSCVNYPTADHPFNQTTGQPFSNIGRVLLDDEAVDKTGMSFFLLHACVSGCPSLIDKACSRYASFISKECPWILSELSQYALSIGNVDVFRAVMSGWPGKDTEDIHRIMKACLFQNMDITKHVLSISIPSCLAQRFEHVCHYSRNISVPATLLKPRIRQLRETAHYLHAKGVLSDKAMRNSLRSLSLCAPIEPTSTPTSTAVRLVIFCLQCGTSTKRKYTKLHSHETCHHCGMEICYVRGCDEYNRGERYVNKTYDAYRQTYGYEYDPHLDDEW